MVEEEERDRRRLDSSYLPAFFVSFHNSNLGRWVGVVTIILVILNTSGILFGWGSIAVLLHDENAYANYCPGQSSGTCEARESRIQLLFTVGTVVFTLGSVPVGIFLDRFGRATTIFLGLWTVSFASLMFSMAPLQSSSLVDGLMIATMFIFWGGASVFVAGMVISSAFPSKRGLIVCLCNCAFDTSSFVPLVFLLCYDYLGATLFQLFAGYALILACITLLTPLWFQFDNERERNEKKEQEECADIELDEIEQNIGDEDTDENKKEEKMKDGIEEVIGEKNSCHLITEELSKLTDFKEIISSWNYLLLLAWLGYGAFISNFYIGTIHMQLSALSGDPDEVDYYIVIFSFLLPVGGVCSALFGFLLDRIGFILAMLLSNSLACGFLLFATIPIIEMQVITFAFFAFWRPLMYSTAYFYLSSVFTVSHFGKLNGIISVLSSLGNLLQYPVLLLIYRFADGNFQSANFLFFLLMVISISFPLYLYRQGFLLKKNFCLAVEDDDPNGEEIESMEAE